MISDFGKDILKLTVFTWIPLGAGAIIAGIAFGKVPTVFLGAVILAFGIFFGLLYGYELKQMKKKSKKGNNNL